MGIIETPILVYPNETQQNCIAKKTEMTKFGSDRFAAVIFSFKNHPLV